MTLTSQPLLLPSSARCHKIRSPVKSFSSVHLVGSRDPMDWTFSLQTRSIISPFGPHSAAIGCCIKENEMCNELRDATRPFLDNQLSRLRLRFLFFQPGKECSFPNSQILLPLKALAWDILFLKYFFVREKSNLKHRNDKIFV